MHYVYAKSAEPAISEDKQEVCVAIKQYVLRLIQHFLFYSQQRGKEFPIDL